MPIYEYQCGECGKRTEAIQRLADEVLTICPSCGGPLTKLMSAPAFQFKGTGWYVTDYADKNKKSGGKSRSSEGGEEASTKSANKSSGDSSSDSSGSSTSSGGSTSSDGSTSDSSTASGSDSS
jgi:putative FmdB family regulatory protein